MERTGLKPIDELVRRAIIGDGTAFTKLWDTYVDALKTYLRSTFSNLDPFFVDDICSRSFEKAFRQIGSFDPSRSRFFTWLKVIAHNTALDTLYQESQSQRNYVHIDDGAEIDIIDTLGDDTADSPLNSIIREEYENQTLRYIEGLPELYRSVARHRLVEGMQYKEIAEETGLELNTVRTRIRRAKAMIEKMKQNESSNQE